jgi:GGDEF domain-containing protein
MAWGAEPDDRVRDLLSAARACADSDHLRALYWATEALALADSRERPEPQLAALQTVIEILSQSGRSRDAVPYVARAVDLAESIQDQAALDLLLDMLGTWAIAFEHTADSARPRKRRANPSITWLASTIARLERIRATSHRISPSARTDYQTSERIHRLHVEIDDPETGLLNSRGLAAELAGLEEQNADYALIRVVIEPTGADSATFVETARRIAEIVNDRGAVSRTEPDSVTIVLPWFTGIAAMALAEHLRGTLARFHAGKDVAIGIGVAIKQPGESGREVLGRVADRASEARFGARVTVVG